MKASTILSLIIVAAIAGGIGYTAALPPAHATAGDADTKGTRRIQFYQSPMHPWIKSDQPGKCTICGMTLVPVYEGDAGISTGDGIVTLAPAAASVIGVQTAGTVKAPLVRTLRVTGIVDDDETRHRYLASYTDARIEKLFVNSTGVEVTKGQPLAVLYSPDLLTARQEFHALATAAPGSALLAPAREKLRRLGLLDTQIDDLAKPGDVARDTEILATKTGTVVERSPTAYEGGYVKAGEMLFAIGDFQKMWFVFDAYEPDLPDLHIGQSVTVSIPSLSGATFTAPIAFIDPNLDAMTRTAKVRVILENADRRLRHRLTASGLVAIEAADVLVAPRSAVLHTQRSPLVYVELADHTYAPRIVKTGRVGDNTIEILDGLKPGEKVVTQGALLIDGQAQLAHSAQSGTGILPVSEKTTTPLPAALTLATADAASALATDDLAAYAKLLPALTAAVHQSGAAHDTLMPLAEKLVAGPDLKTARTAFEPFTTAVADLVRAQPADRRENLHIFQCPMAPATGKARWLQRDAALKNPFFGSEMIDCGVELKP
ncbi:MAG: efflux RND transporter periplasmic adaptor subunit [Opitutaceae bacterium]|jgi:Cu(I)/Ag(I) efflux system membrane fusion protein